MPEAEQRTFRRDQFLDSWRGIFHVAMLVDHLPFVLPGIFPVIAGLYEIGGFVTAAEGFVFLSGYVSGIVYTRVMREHGSAAVWRKAARRAAGIYICYLLAVIGLVLSVRIFGHSALSWGSWEPLLDEPVGSSLLQVAALFQQPTFLEILPMYSGLLLLVPLLVAQMEKGRWPMILALSVGVWVAAQFNARTWLLKLLPFHAAIHLGYFNAVAWQVLFVIGLLCGHRTTSSKAPWLPKGGLLPGISYSIVCVLLFMRHGWLATPFFWSLTERATVAPVRLVDFLSVVFLVCKLRPWLEKWIAWRGLAFLSRHSLPVFAFHIFPIYLATLVMLPERRHLPTWLQLLFVAFCVGGIFVIAFFARYVEYCWKKLSLARRVSPARVATGKGVNP